MSLLPVIGSGEYWNPGRNTPGGVLENYWWGMSWALPTAMVG